MAAFPATQLVTIWSWSPFCSTLGLSHCCKKLSADFGFSCGRKPLCERHKMHCGRYGDCFISSLRKQIPLLHSQIWYPEVSPKLSFDWLNEGQLNCDWEFDWVLPEKNVAVLIWKSPGETVLLHTSVWPCVGSNWYVKLKGIVWIVLIGLNICFNFCYWLELPAVNNLKKWSVMLFCLFMRSSWKCENHRLMESRV